MKENNGKIAIAIVAMFVVALSVVGFTYAYFTATVKGNTADKSVEVTAGRLEIVYANGNELTANNVVPGWISDDAHFYDPVASLYDIDGEGSGTAMGIKAVKVGDPKITVAAGEQAAYGKQGPVTFDVSNAQGNDGDNHYVIKLTNITNEIADSSNLYYSLYEGETLISSGNLVPDVNKEQIISDEIDLPKADTTTHSYTLKLGYKNNTTDTQDASKNKAVKATVVIMPVATNQAGTLVDADNKAVTIPNLNTTTDNINWD